MRPILLIVVPMLAFITSLVCTLTVVLTPFWFQAAILSTVLSCRIFIQHLLMWCFGYLSSSEASIIPVFIDLLVALVLFGLTTILVNHALPLWGLVLMGLVSSETIYHYSFLMFQWFANINYKSIWVRLQFLAPDYFIMIDVCLIAASLSIFLGGYWFAPSLLWAQCIQIALSLVIIQATLMHLYRRSVVLIHECQPKDEYHNDIPVGVFDKLMLFSMHCSVNTEHCQCFLMNTGHSLPAMSVKCAYKVLVLLLLALLRVITCQLHLIL